MFDVRCSMFDVRCSMFDVGCWMFDVRCSMLDVRCSMFDVGCSMLDVGLLDCSVRRYEGFFAFLVSADLCLAFCLRDRSHATGHSHNRTARRRRTATSGFMEGYPQ